jgi:hypothetical protein
MISLRASVALFSLAAGGCSMLHHGATAGDAGAGDAGAVAMVVLDAGPPPPAAPENVNQVGRYPDEVSLNDTAAKIADPNVAARNGVPGGALVATLRIGTPVTQLAKHESFILCVFPDPKSPSRNLEGWVAEQAFVPGPTVPSKASCPAGQTRLMFDEQDFCGKVCKTDGDCQSGQACAGKASLFANGKVGADVTTCTIPAGGGGTSSGAGGSAGKVVPGIQVEPLPGNTCPITFVLAADKLCHRDCSKGPCPAGGKCARALGAAICEPE